ncbi:hypothetical protein BGW38_010501 [Lunasporangiospora selenospora]|uniref:C-CAP/cofactor C-like domain-containing protein n=1 Tax=Lunasporangiospora selenospora TaxID=979761 RepID=A0A9P6FWF1_9FUNG|nr:hypothetical protein BGW38_010501 [Lunasporangiospora selenospora]
MMATSVADAARQFRASFDPERSKQELAALDNVPKTEIQQKIDELLQRIRALEKAVTENVQTLPAFETRVCLEAVRAMSEQLTMMRSRLVPRLKFTFKSRKTAASSSSLLFENKTESMDTDSSTSAMDTRPSTPGMSEVDQSLFMKFENRTGEHLFIGALDLASPSVPMKVDGEEENNEVKDAASLLNQARDVALTNLEDCTVNLVHDTRLGAIHIRNLKRCTVVIPPVAGSILLHDCEGCTLIGACHQSRMHTSSNMDIYLHVTSEPIIEDCTDMRFAPYPYDEILTPERLARVFEDAGLDQTANYYQKVKDFNWLRQQQSPNWKVMSEDQIHSGVAQKVLALDRH